MSLHAKANDTDALLTEAATWRFRLTEAGVASTPAFEAWMREPANSAAWEQVCGPWDYLGEQASAPEFGLELQKAKTHAWHARAHRQNRHLWPRIAMAAAVGFLIAVTGWGGLRWADSPDTYSANLGERRVIALVDGSHVSLDSNSEVSVLYTKNARELHLKRGQARFDVAHDVERPFSVIAGDQKVIATGTAFNIDMAGPKVIVTLIEGQVVVLEDQEMQLLPTPHTLPRRPQVQLKAGQQLATRPETPPEIAVANLERVTAWTNGQLVFDNEPLSSVIERVNRYTKTPIMIDDPNVGAMRISGLFSTGDVGGFIETVTQYLPLQAVPSSTSVQLRPKS